VAVRDFANGSNDAFAHLNFLVGCNLIIVGVCRKRCEPQRRTDEGACPYANRTDEGVRPRVSISAGSACIQLGPKGGGVHFYKSLQERGNERQVLKGSSARTSIDLPGRRSTRCRMWVE